MGGRLLVGVAQGDDHSEPRRVLVDLLTALDGLGLRPQVVMVRDGPVRRELEEVGDVRLMRDPRPRSPAALVEGAARRIHPRAADAVRSARTADRRRWIHRPDVIHLNSPQAVPLLHLVDGREATVTTYVHPGDLGVEQLSPVDRDLLVACTDRFLTADEATAETLVSMPGIAPERVVVAPRPLVSPARRLTLDQRASGRRSVGLPAEGIVIAVPPVPDWVRAPDLTIATAWEVQRLRPVDPPPILWFGGPAEEAARWPIEEDLRRSGVAGHVHLDPALSTTDVLPLVDLVVPPSRTADPVDATFVKQAQAHGVPLLCWEGDAVAEEVRSWTGEVVAPPDVGEMAARVVALSEDRSRRQHLAERGRALLLDELELFVPLDLGR